MGAVNNQQARAGQMYKVGVVCNMTSYYSDIPRPLSVMVLSSDGAVALVWGIILTLSLELLLLLLWLRRQPVATPSENEFPPFIRTRSPQVKL